MVIFLVAAKVSFITPSDKYERNTLVILECNVTGDPSPNVTWINITDGSVLQTSTTETSYLIPNISFHHKGIYRCVAENKCGRDSRTMKITDVYSKSTIESFIRTRSLICNHYQNVILFS